MRVVTVSWVLRRVVIQHIYSAVGLMIYNDRYLNVSSGLLDPHVKTSSSDTCSLSFSIWLSAWAEPLRPHVLREYASLVHDALSIWVASRAKTCLEKISRFVIRFVEREVVWKSHMSSHRC